jgi:hypothetical protein
MVFDGQLALPDGLITRLPAIQDLQAATLCRHEGLLSIEANILSA